MTGEEFWDAIAPLIRQILVGLKNKQPEVTIDEVLDTLRDLAKRKEA